MIKQINTRLLFGLGFLSALFAIGTSIFYFQLYKGLIPCPLCELQRIVVITLGIFYAISWLHNPKNIGIRIYSIIIFLFALIGLAIAIQQLWLQSLPADQAPACGPGLNYLLTTLPLKQSIVAIFKGTGECFQVQWRLFSISIPGWSAIFFAGHAVMNIWQALRSFPHKLYGHFNA